MAELPSTRRERLQYVLDHLSALQTNAEAVGLTPTQVLDLTTAANDCDDKLTAMGEARNQSKAATQAFYQASDVVDGLIRDYIKTIKAFAETTNDPEVYQLAQIDPPQPPSPRPAPDVPANVTASMDNNGFVTLSWSGSRAFGVSFVIERALEPVGGQQGAWSQLATVGANTFVDDGVPAGQKQAFYRIKAMRRDKASTWSMDAVVNFGIATESSSSSAPSGGDMSMAA